MHGEPLNPDLYNRLHQLFGTVEIAREGEAMIGGPIPGTRTYQFQQKGEYYRVSCPYCSDTRKRLWISHAWGVPDRYGNSHWWMLICFNERCTDNEANRKDLITRVYKGIGRERRAQIRIAEGREDTGEIGPVTWPGEVTPINRLHPTHPAAIYLRDERGYDLDRLYWRWGVHFHEGFCPDYREMTDRIVIPVIMNGEMVSWQGRYVGTTDWRVTPKYFTRTNANKSKMLYNYDVAKQQPFGVLVEGVTDVWSLEDVGVAMLGDQFSTTQAELALQAWRALVVVVDSLESYYKSEEMYDQLNQKIPVVQVTLPDGADPDSLDNDYLWSLIDGCARQRGLDLLEMLKT